MKSRQLLQPGSSSGKSCNDSALYTTSTSRRHVTISASLSAQRGRHAKKFSYSVWEARAIATRHFLCWWRVKLPSHPTIRYSPRLLPSLHTTPKLATCIARKIEVGMSNREGCRGTTTQSSRIYSVASWAAAGRWRGIQSIIVNSKVGLYRLLKPWTGASQEGRWRRRNRKPAIGARSTDAVSRHSNRRAQTEEETRRQPLCKGRPECYGGERVCRIDTRTWTE